MTKPKGKTPSLLSQSNGKPFKETCNKGRTCNRCDKKIKKNEKFFIMGQKSGGFNHKNPFCTNCMKLIIEQTKKELFYLENELESIINND